MQSTKKKLIIAIAFISIIMIVGVVMYFTFIHGKKPIKATGYKTHYNPRFIDSVKDIKKKN